jgi:hypothetical protein
MDYKILTMLTVLTSISHESPELEPVWMRVPLDQYSCKDGSLL